MSENAPHPPDVVAEVNDDIDATVEDEINRDVTQADAMNLDGANDAEPAAVNGATDATTAFEARIPAKKDATLREFLGKMDEYAPIVSSSPFVNEIRYTKMASDTRCSHELLLDARGSTTTSPNLTSSCPPPCSGNTEVHCGYRCRCISVLPYTVIKYPEQ